MYKENKLNDEIIVIFRKEFLWISNKQLMANNFTFNKYKFMQLKLVLAIR